MATACQNAATPVTINYGCPDWCERTDHEADEVVSGEFAYHYGPDFGNVGLQGHIDGIFATMRMDEWERINDPAALRQIASDALAAAQWWEAHQ